MFRSLAEDAKEVVNVASGEMVRACDGDELKSYFGKNVQHWSERSPQKK